MRKLVKLMLFLLYDYYDDTKWAKTPYFSSVLVFLFFVSMNLWTLIGSAGIDPLQVLPWWSPEDERGIQYLQLALLYFIPGFFIVRFFVKEDELKESNYKDSTINRGYFFLISYFVLSFVAFVLIALSKKT